MTVLDALRIIYRDALKRRVMEVADACMISFLRYELECRKRQNEQQ